MKLRFFYLVTFLLVFNVSLSSAQEHISHFFELESEIVLPDNSCVGTKGKIIGCMDEELLYLCNAEVLNQRKKGYLLEIDVWNLEDASQEKIQLPLPPLKTGALGGGRYWVYAIAAHNGKIAVSTHSHLFLFDVRNQGAGRLEHSIPFPDADYAFFHGDQLYTVSQINDFGFLLSSVKGTRLDSVAVFPLSAPFLLQFGPNGFLKPHGSRLFLLDAPNAKLRHFDLQGNQRGELCLEMPNWDAMTDEYIESIRSIPYSGDRAMHIFNTSTQYSFPLEIFPVNDSVFLMAYHQYAPDIKQFKIPFLFVKMTSAGKLVDLRVLTTDFAEDHLLEADEFPVLYADRALRFVTSGGNRLVQVVKSAGIPYSNRLWKTYREDEEDFFAHHEPVSKIRVMRLKSPEISVPVDSVQLVDIRGKHFVMDSIPTHHAIFVMNNPPQCHVCEESVCDFLNDLALGDCSVYVIERKAFGALARREIVQKEQSRLKVPFSTLFVPAEGEIRLSTVMKDQAYPLVLLWEKGKSTMKIVSGNNLFPDDPWETRIRPDAQMKIRQFAR